MRSKSQKGGVVMAESGLTQAGQAKNPFRYDEEWEVYVSNQKEPYVLNEMEFAVFKDAQMRGIKGMIHYEKFGINLAFVTSYFLRKKTLKKQFQLAEPKKEAY